MMPRLAFLGLALLPLAAQAETITMAGPHSQSAVARQNGGDAMVNQRGSGQTTTIIQAGHGNTARVVQRGAGNAAAVRQSGGVSMDSQQTGHGHSYTLDQTAPAGHIVIRQSDQP